ncbi:MAG: hypothetical protein WBG18_19445 [Xanthobacteraceae bacterium]
MANDDIPPPDIQESVRIFRAWAEANPNGDIAPADVHAHALKIQNYRRTQGDLKSQRVESAIDRFKRLERSDSPPSMPAWSRELAGNSQPQPGERAANKFKRQRLAQNEKGNSNAR